MNKLYIEVCEICGKECRSLSRHFWKAHGEGVNHKPFTGKNHSKEAKEKVRQSRIGKSSGMLGKKGYCPPHTIEIKKKISESMKGNRNANHRGDRQSFYFNIRMDSSWEVKTAQFLEENNFDWKYSVQGYKLSDNRVYYPDFFIYNEEELIKVIEVKGFFRPENKAKFEQFLKEYPEVPIELWDKKKLIELNIL